MFGLAPGAYLASHPLLAYGVMFVLSCIKPGLIYASVWVVFALTYGFDTHLVLAIGIVGDWVNDTGLYWLGRIGGFTARLARPRLKLHSLLHRKRLLRLLIAFVRARNWLERNLKKYPWLCLFGIKSPLFAFIPGTGGPMIATVGALRFPYRRFFPIAAFISVFWVSFYYELVLRIGAPILETVVVRLKQPVLYTVLGTALGLVIALFIRNQILPRLKGHIWKK